MEKSMDALIKKLSAGKHAVLLEPKLESLYEIQERLSLGFVFLKFTETAGGTELGINLDSSVHLEKTNIKEGKGSIKIIGSCKLNFQEVRCIADINLATRQGIGYIEVLN